jgi:hypothetical protein
MAEAGVVVENWDELLVPAQGRLVYVGQGQYHYVHFHEPTPGILWPKKKRRKKKKPTPQPPAPSEPAEDWKAEISPPVAAYPQLEDWDAEIAASQLKPFSGVKPQRPFSGPPISFEKMLCIDNT